MKLHDPNTINFDGTPVTGRVPPKLRVEGGRELTQQQTGAVMHAYKLFRDAARLSVADFQVQNRTLADGTRVRMESMQDQDTVYVWPTGGEEETKLPHGFAVVTNWRKPKIFKRVPALPVDTRWAFAGDVVRQVKDETYIYDNQVFRKPTGRPPFNLPMVFRRAVKQLWDYGVRGALNLTPQTLAVPFRIKDSVTGVFSMFPAHYALENRVVDAAGTTLYTMANATGILGPLAMGYPEAVHHLPPATDAEGNQLALQQWRYAMVSEFANIWTFRTCNERLRRVSPIEYEAIARNTVDLSVPSLPQTVTTVSEVLLDIGEEIDPAVIVYKFNYGSGENGAGWFPDPGVFITWQAGLTEAPVDEVASHLIVGEGAFRQNIAAVSGGFAPKSNIMAVPSATQVEYASLDFGLNFPTTVFWRGGYKKLYINPAWDFFSGGFFGVTAKEIKRINTQYSVDGTPKIKMVLPWKDVLLLDGTTTARFTGHRYEDILTTSHDFSAYEGNLMLLDVVTRPAPPAGMTSLEKYNFLASNNVRDTYVAGIIADYPNTTPIPTVDDVRPSNTGSYSYTSRHVIDFDNKGQFYTAIKVEVVCTGASWREDRDFYDGFMVENARPSYTVTISFESQWGAVSASQVLYSGSCTRPGVEFLAVSKINPYYWDVPAYADRDTKVRVPPQISPPSEFFMQLGTFAESQSVNTRLCCADVRPDIVGADVALTQSAAGIEYSTLSGGRVVPHTRYVTGQLYARTFRLSDFPEAVWLITALKCDAPLNGIYQIEGVDQPLWHYHPGIPAAMSALHHIEIRDGIIGNWSDELPGETSGYPPTAAPPPADVTTRDIKLYRV